MAVWSRRKKYSIDENIPKKGFLGQLSKLAKREVWVMVLSIGAIAVLILGSSYAIFTSVNRSREYNVIKVGTLRITFQDTDGDAGNIIKLTNTFPVSDGVGSEGDPYQFKITNTGSLAANYTIRIVDDEAMITEDDCAGYQLPKEFIKYTLNEGEPMVLNEEVIATGTLAAHETMTYRLKMWVSDTADNEVLGTHFHGKIVVEAEGTELTTTPEECFTFSEGTISEYKCYAGNSEDLPTITRLVIPSSIQGVPVTTIGENVFQNEDLTTVVLPASLTTIGSFSFASNLLTTVVIPESVMYLGSYAFQNNPLTSVIMEKKQGPSDFIEYAPDGRIFSNWANSTCESHSETFQTAQYHGDEANPCIQWES